MNDIAGLFLDSLRMKKRSASTLEIYERAIKEMMSYPLWKDPREFGRMDITGLAEWMKAIRRQDGEEVTAGTKAMKIRVLKQYFAWLVEENHILTNPAKHLVLPEKTRFRPQKVLDENEIRRLLKSPELWTSIGLRDCAVIEVFYSTGMRRMELLALNVTDVDTATGHVRIRHGKGNRERVVPLGTGASRALTRYLSQARVLLMKERCSGRPADAAHGGKRNCHEVLFVSINGSPMTSGNINRMLYIRGEQAGVGRVSSHMLRRTCATHLCRAGMPLPAIQQILGHSDLMTTRVYLKLSIYEAKETHQERHPRETMRLKNGNVLKMGAAGKTGYAPERGAATALFDGTKPNNPEIWKSHCTTGN